MGDGRSYSEAMTDSRLLRSLSTLIGILLVSVAVAVPTEVALAWPLIYLSESVLHLGCSSTTIDGQQVWVCPDGIGYVIPGVALVVLLTIVGVVVGIFVQRDALRPPAAAID